MVQGRPPRKVKKAVTVEYRNGSVIQNTVDGSIDNDMIKYYYRFRFMSEPPFFTAMKKIRIREVIGQ